MSDVYGDGMEWGNDKYYVKDTHNGNVVVKKDGSVVIIDANAKYNEKYKGDVYGSDGFVLEDVESERTEKRFDEGCSKSGQQSEHKSRIAKHIDKLLKKLGTKTRTTVYHSLDELPERYRKHIEERHRQGRKVRGWYEKGQIFLFLPDINSKYEAEKTIWHETVAHHGLRELIGTENYNKLLTRLWLQDGWILVGIVPTQKCLLFWSSS